MRPTVQDNQLSEQPPYLYALLLSCGKDRSGDRISQVLAAILWVIHLPPEYHTQLQ